MNRYLFVLISILLISCNKNQGKLELEILNREVVSCKLPKNSIFPENLVEYNSISLNVIRYKLTNNSSTTYYFNKNYTKVYKMRTYLEGQMSTEENTIFVDEKGNTAKIPFSCRYPSDSMRTYTIFSDRFKEKAAKALGYGKNAWDIPPEHNFIIHPGETLYFEYFLHLPIDFSESDNSFFVLDKSKKYKMKIQVYSDSTNYKKTISKSDISTIKENNYSVYHGIITSKNEVPLKFVDCRKKQKDEP